MLIYTLAFVLGDLLYQISPEANIWVIELTLVTMSFCFFWLFDYKKIIAVNVLFLSGYYLTCFSQWDYFHIHEKMEISQNPVLIQGVISSLIVRDEFGQHFLFKLTKLDSKNSLFGHPTYLRLTNSSLSDHLHVGEEWVFMTRLRAPKGLKNSYGFDFEKWLSSEQIKGLGYVKQNDANKLIARHYMGFVFNILRERIQQQALNKCENKKTVERMLPLMIGERSYLSSDDWLVLRKTGANHLMAIAGLHLGIVAFLVSKIGFAFIRRPFFMLTNIEMVSLISLFVTWLYSALAGSSLPTTRAILMVLISYLLSLRRQRLNRWLLWSLVLFLTLLVNPSFLLSDSFYLSFCTIAIVIYGMAGRLDIQTVWWKWFRIQWVIWLGLFPVSLYFYQDASLVSFLANSIAVPLLGFFVLPLCLMSIFLLIFFPWLAGLPLYIAGKSVNMLWMMLTFFSHFNRINLPVFINTPIELTIVMAGITLLLIPAGAFGRWFGILWLLPIFFPATGHIKYGECVIDVLDVGQGLSVVVRTSGHVLLYDAGPKLGSKMDAGENVILPFIKSKQIQNIDKLIVSHGDNDHIGGSAAIIKHVNVSQILTSVPASINAKKAAYCLQGQSWWWDGVYFEMLYPVASVLGRVNDSSCVLRVKAGNQSLLLPGDIEKFAEKQLLQMVPEKLKSDVMIAPHHGSKTSSLPQFIAAVQPQYVVYSTGYRNRYHFPHPSVQAKYLAINARQFNTAETGAIEMKIGVSHRDIPVQLQRQVNN